MPSPRCGHRVLGVLVWTQVPPLGNAHGSRPGFGTALALPIVAPRGAQGRQGRTSAELMGGVPAVFTAGQRQRGSCWPWVHRAGQPAGIGPAYRGHAQPAVAERNHTPKAQGWVERGRCLVRAPKAQGHLGGYSRLLGVHRGISFPKRGPPPPVPKVSVLPARYGILLRSSAGRSGPPQLASGGLSVPSRAPVHLSMEDSPAPCCASDWPAEPCPAGLLCRPVLASGEWRWLALDAEEELALRVDSAIGEQSAGPGRLSGRHPRGRRLCPHLCLRVAAPSCDPTGLSHMSKWPGVRAAV